AERGVDLEALAVVQHVVRFDFRLELLDAACHAREIVERAAEPRAADRGAARVARAAHRRRELRLARLDLLDLALDLLERVLHLVDGRSGGRGLLLDLAGLALDAVLALERLAREVVVALLEREDRFLLPAPRVVAQVVLLLVE